MSVEEDVFGSSPCQPEELGCHHPEQNSHASGGAPTGPVGVTKCTLEGNSKVGKEKRRHGLKKAMRKDRNSTSCASGGEPEGEAKVNHKRGNFFSNLFSLSSRKSSQSKTSKKTACKSSQSEDCLSAGAVNIPRRSSKKSRDSCGTLGDTDSGLVTGSVPLPLNNGNRKNRLGYALAYTGTCVGAMPILSSALHQASLTDTSGNVLVTSETDHSRSVSVQTEMGVHVSPEDIPLYVTVPRSASPQPQQSQAPLASMETLLDDTSGVVLIPVIHEELDHSAPLAALGAQAAPSGMTFLCPELSGSRKSSTGDSAVDLKFCDDDSKTGKSTPRSAETAAPDTACPTSKATEETIDRCQTSSTQVVKSPVENGGQTSGKSVFKRNSSSSASWRKLRHFVIWTPFIQQYHRHKYPWIQLAGHQGNFRSGDQGTILKKHCSQERMCLEALMKDPLQPFVPEYKGVVENEGEKYVRMQDLLKEFDAPSLMDCKMGVRTYLEDELSKAKENPKPRQDMYEKMIEIDPDEPTAEERASKTVTKPRYMQWRETISSTCLLGFRIEGVKKHEQADDSESEKQKQVGTSTRDFKRTRTREEVKAALDDFTEANSLIVMRYLKRLICIRNTLESSEFFAKNELIGSSLLFVHDKCGECSVWMIDFGKTVPLPPGVKVSHRDEWAEGNHEDGYLFGLDNMISILLELSGELGGPISEEALLESSNQNCEQIRRQTSDQGLVIDCANQRREQSSVSVCRDDSKSPSNCESQDWDECVKL